MGQRTKYSEGTFSWADLSTPAQPEAKRFYSAVFDWTFEDLPMDGDAVYSMASVSGQAVAAISPQPQAQRDNGLPPIWNSFVTVASADASAERATELGAHVHAGPFDVMEAGRMAVVHDPQGAFVMLWEPRNHRGAGLVNTAGALAWNELTTPDIEGSKEFYSGLFGWTFEQMEGMPEGMEYWVIKRADGGTNGGLVPPMSPEQPTAWLAYFACDDIDATLGRLTEHGGGRINGPMTIAGGAKIAVVHDPQGGVFALYDGPLED